MDSLSRRDLSELLAGGCDPCLSAYFPTHPFGQDGQAGRIRLKNLATQAEDILRQRGLRAPAARDFLAPIRGLLDAEDFWNRQSQGVALFLDGEGLRTWRLPLPFPTLVQVGRRFHTKPLLPVVEDHDRYYVLAVSENEVGLYRGTRFGLTKLDTKALPENLVEALNFQQPEGAFQVRSVHVGGVRSVGRGKRAKEAAVFHGQGAADHAKEDLVAYFRAIDRGLHDLLRVEQAPLVFAGVDYLFPLYRQVNTYPHLWFEAIHGNPAAWNTVELHARAHPVIEPYLHQVRAGDARRIQEHRGSERVSADLEQILPAAHEGRVEAIFVASDVDVWGSYDATSRRLALATQRPVGSEDLLDVAASAALSRGGRAYAVAARELPAGIVASALFRYAAARPLGPGPASPP